MNTPMNRRRRPRPRFRLFGNPDLQAAAMSGIALNIGKAVVAIELSLLWQYVYRYTPFGVSLGQMPFVIASIFAASWAGSLLARGVRLQMLLPGGLLMFAVALAVMACAGAIIAYYRVGRRRPLVEDGARNGQHQADPMRLKDVPGGHRLERGPYSAA